MKISAVVTVHVVEEMPKGIGIPDNVHITGATVCNGTRLDVYIKKQSNLEALSSFMYEFWHVAAHLTGVPLNDHHMEKMGELVSELVHKAVDKMLDHQQQDTRRPELN